MAQIPHQSSGIPSRQIGIECFHGFGDCLFAIPLAKAIQEQTGHKIGIATKPSCMDAFHNIPWIDEILPIAGMDQGANTFVKHNYKTHYQCTPNSWWTQMKGEDQNTSLLDMIHKIGQRLGFKPFNNRPIFIPTTQELKTQELIGDEPIIAIESIYFSGQSWATKTDFDYILSKHPKNRILWLSHTGHPKDRRIIPSTSLTRRQLICCLQKAETFYSVGSGFFCASLALPTSMQPKKIVCLWIDQHYKYEGRLSELNWHNNIQWVHNSSELRNI